MRCERCGGTIAGAASRCPGCGASIGIGVLTPPPKGATEPSAGAESADRTPRPGTDPGDGDAPTILTGGDQLTVLAPQSHATPSTNRSASAAPSTDHGPLGVGQAFGSRYHIIKMLGVGGMGAVYQAWDAELAEAVAIKVIRPEVTADPQTADEVARRFKRELVLARQVTHKNVVRIHDLGEMDGIKYITMPYIEGDDLATLIKKHNGLPVPRALRITRSIVSGLVAAHAAGIVHRDLKPANIMIDAEEEAMIMDFGIARSTGAPVGNRVPGAQTIVDNIRQAASSPQDATVYGAVVGTVEYMAPEQARGVAVDQRADVYALGLIFYDMLVGRSRGAAVGNLLVELQARMEKPPPSVKTLVPEVPDALEAVISRCLEPDPGKRFQSTADLLSELGRLDDNGEAIRIKRVVGLPIVWAVVSLALMLLATTWYFAQKSAVPEQRPAVSVLIADFENRANDPVFERSLEQALGIAVEGASFVNTFPRDEAEKIVATLKAGNRLDENAARLVSRREGINIILAGAIETRNAGYTISVKAIDSANGNTLGTASASAASKADVLKAVGSVASRIRSTLGDATPESKKVQVADAVSTGSLEALADFSRAQDLLHNLKDEEAITHYRRATERDPNFGRAYANWATAAGNLGRRDEAAELWKKALALTDRMTDRERYRTLAGYHLAVTQNYEKAIESYNELIKNYPYDSSGHVNLALAHFYKRDFAKALEVGRTSIQIDSRDLINRSNYALYAMYAGHFKTAAEEAQKVIERDPKAFRAYMPLAVAALANSDRMAAGEAYARMAQADAQGAAVANIGLADLAMYEGRFGDAIALLKSRVAEDQKTKDTAYGPTNLLMLAEAYEIDGTPGPALQAVRAAVKMAPRRDSVAVPAARLLARLGNETEAQAIASGLSQRLEAHRRAYAATIEGEIAQKRQRTVDAVTAFLGALKLTDLWLARFDLGVAYVQAGHYAEGLTDLLLCQKRRGEASSIFLDDVPSFRYLATLPYWLGRAEEGVGNRAAAAEHYKNYLQIRSAAKRDPLAVDARRRLTNLSPVP
jgi:eukaryotic-like serine/threonine-protein kinase